MSLDSDRFPVLTAPGECYATWRPSERHEGGDWMSGFFPWVADIWVDTKTTTVVKVHIRERVEGDPKSSYWAWEGPDDPGELRMVQGSPGLFEMQFPYGVAAAEKAGQGRRVNVLVEVLERFEPQGSGVKS